MCKKVHKLCGKYETIIAVRAAKIYLNFVKKTRYKSSRNPLGINAYGTYGGSPVCAVLLCRYFIMQSVPARLQLHAYIPCAPDDGAQVVDGRRSPTRWTFFAMASRSAEILREFVSRVIVHSPEDIGGTGKQRIQIIYNGIILPGQKHYMVTRCPHRGRTKSLPQFQPFND